jgi:hypothetical protein
LIDLRQTALVTLEAYAAQVPLFLVWLAGIALAVRSWRRQGTISLLTVIAIGLASVNSLLATYLDLWLPILLEQRGWAVGQIGIAYAAAGVFQSLLLAASWGLVLTAIFGWRRSPEPGALSGS